MEPVLTCFGIALHHIIIRIWKLIQSCTVCCYRIIKLIISLFSQFQLPSQFRKGREFHIYNTVVEMVSHSHNVKFSLHYPFSPSVAIFCTKCNGEYSTVNEVCTVLPTFILTKLANGEILDATLHSSCHI